MYYIWNVHILIASKNIFLYYSVIFSFVSQDFQMPWSSVRKQNKYKILLVSVRDYPPLNCMYIIRNIPALQSFELPCWNLQHTHACFWGFYSPIWEKSAYTDDLFWKFKLFISVDLPGDIFPDPSIFFWWMKRFSIAF